MLVRGLRAPLAVAWLVASTGCMAFGPRDRPSYVAQHVDGGKATNLGLAPVVVFQDGTGSLSYHAPTYADLPAHVEVRDVQGRACESGLQVPWGVLTQPSSMYLEGLYASVGWGDSGYTRALRDAANQVAPDALLYDVRADLQTINVLSIWRQSCIVVTASAVTRLPSDDAPLVEPAAEQPTVGEAARDDGPTPTAIEASETGQARRTAPTRGDDRAKATAQTKKPETKATTTATPTPAEGPVAADPGGVHTPMSPAPGGTAVGAPTVPPPAALRPGGGANPNVR